MQHCILERFEGPVTPTAFQSLLLISKCWRQRLAMHCRHITITCPDHLRLMAPLVPHLRVLEVEAFPLGHEQDLIEHVRRLEHLVKLDLTALEDEDEDISSDVVAGALADRPGLYVHTLQPSPFYSALKEGEDLGPFFSEQRGSFNWVLDLGGDPYTALCFAAWEGYAESVRQLLEHGAPIEDTVNPDGETALHIAAGSGEAEVVALLLQHGASPNAHDKRGRTPLVGAAYAGCTASVRALLDHGARVDAAAHDGTTALSCACGRGQLAVAKLLLERGASAREAPPIFQACKQGHDAVARLLLDHGAPMDATGPDGTTLVQAAEGHEAVLAVLKSAR